MWPRETRFVPRENRPFWKLRERRRREQDETKIMVAERERKRLYSEILDRMIPIQVTSHALRCIDKAGGLDNYVLNTRAEKMVSAKGLIEREDDASIAQSRGGRRWCWGRPEKRFISAAAANVNEKTDRESVCSYRRELRRRLLYFFLVPHTRRA